MRSSALSSPPLNSSSTSASSSAFLSVSSFYIWFSSLLSSLSSISSTRSSKRASTSLSTIPPSSHFASHPSSFAKSSPLLSLRPLHITSLSFLFVVLLVLFQCCLVVALPPVYHSSYPPLETGNGEIVVERTTYFTKNHTWENGTMHVQADMPQSDDPTRNLNSAERLPESWRGQYQGRYGYLVAENNQHIYIKNGRILGTKMENPKRGIVQLRSHEMQLVIKSLHDDSFICMNGSGNVYMSVILNNKDCVMEERSLMEEGFNTKSYEFAGHRSSKRALYLGIDCEAIKGTETAIEQESSRFTVLSVTPTDAARFKHEVSIGMEESLTDFAKCIKKKGATKRKKLKKKLKAHWCRNYSRIRSNIRQHLDKCNRKYCKSEGPKNCVCSELKKMFMNKEKTKRECLVKHIVNWVKKHDGRPNKVFIKTFTNILMPRYDAIMKRIRQQRRLKLNKKTKKTNKKVNRVDSAAKPKPLPSESRAKTPRKKGRKGKRGRGKNKNRSKKVKLSLLLKRYWPQLTGSVPSSAGSRGHHYQNDSPTPPVSTHAQAKISSSPSSKLSAALSSSLSSSSLLSGESSESSSSSSVSLASPLLSSPSSSSSSSSSLLLHHLTADVSNNEKTKYNDKNTSSLLPSSNSKRLRSASDSSLSSSPSSSSPSSSSSSSLSTSSSSSSSSPLSSSSSSSLSSASRLSPRKHRIRHSRKLRKRRRKNRKMKDTR